MVSVQTKLEVQIDEAIAAGDLSKAESLSEHLANREVSQPLISPPYHQAVNMFLLPGTKCSILPIFIIVFC